MLKGLVKPPVNEMEIFQHESVCHLYTLSALFNDELLYELYELLIRVYENLFFSRWLINFGVQPVCFNAYTFFLPFIGLFIA